MIAMDLGAVYKTRVPKGGRHQHIALDLQLPVAGKSQFCPECHCPRHSEEMSVELILPLPACSEEAWQWPSLSSPLLSSGGVTFLQPLWL